MGNSITKLQITSIIFQNCEECVTGMGVQRINQKLYKLKMK
jgi:hypothetical protein